MGGLGVVYKVTGAATGGAFAIVEHPLRPGALAGPPHTHAHEDEFSYVLEGRVGFLVGEEAFEADEGAYVAKPRGLAHTFWNAGAAPARIMEMIAPGGFERYFEELAAILAVGPEPDIGRITALAGRYGLTLHMERLAEISQTHGVAVG